MIPIGSTTSTSGYGGMLYPPKCAWLNARVRISLVWPHLAAAYAHGIVQNHPFLDGNKRTGFMAAATFLEVNDLEFTASEADVVVATLALADRKMSEKEYAAWLQANSR